MQGGFRRFSGTAQLYPLHPARSGNFFVLASLEIKAQGVIIASNIIGHWLL